MPRERHSRSLNCIIRALRPLNAPLLIIIANKQYQHQRHTHDHEYRLASRLESNTDLPVETE